jgi:glycosyltransferase involved in cell wall biosynthesis
MRAALTRPSRLFFLFHYWRILMELISLPPANLGTSTGSSDTLQHDRTGAIASSMAVAFREEKLALREGSDSTVRANEASSFASGAQLPRGTGIASRSNVPIIVHSHLRWDFVWQRPQQLLSRLVIQHPILFVEEPVDTSSHASLDILLTPEGVVRVIPRLPNLGALSVDEQCLLVLPLLDRALQEHPLLAGRFASPMQWFYSPMTAPSYCGRFGSIAIIYDCMDELASFRFAPEDIAEREAFLLSNADLVFTGGHELYRSKAARHSNTHFFGCGVDADHFACARKPETVIPPELDALARPILGYFGVIDERLDYALIEELARRLPEASIAMVGPLAKVRQEDLPNAANIHWLGSRSYEDLPAIVKAFDVCLMPFAMNAATQFINPTKTLEYLAAGKPVVSTAVPDVVRQYTDVVDVAGSIEAYIDCVEGVLGEVDSARIEKGVAMARSSSWNSTVAAMRGHLLGTLARKRGISDRVAVTTDRSGMRFAQAAIRE